MFGAAAVDTVERGADLPHGFEAEATRASAERLQRGKVYSISLYCDAF
jgi:hypothetical protein